MAPSFLRRCKKCGEEYHPIEQSAECPHEKIEPQPDKGLLLTDVEIGDALDLEIEAEYPCSDGGKISTISVDKLLSKAQAHYGAENKELGLLFESAILGVDEANDWSEDGLKNFRKQIMPLIDKHCKKLKAGNLGILYEYLEKKDAECEKRVREIFDEIEDYRQNLAPVYKEAEMWICISARDFQAFKSKHLEALRKGEG
jgi:hypothetical protein